MSKAIISAQSKDIREMNRWRESWFGSASPAGGIPMHEQAPSHDSMGM